MQKPLLIIFALIVVLLLIFLWVYLLFFRTTGPTPIEEVIFPDVPATFPENNIASSSPEQDTTISEDGPRISITDGELLRQLTTGPVSGFIEVFSHSSTTPVVRYAETGTGIIFDIDMETGLKQTLTTTTQAQHHFATFSPLGDRVVLQSDFGKQTQSVLGIDIASSSATRYLDLPRGIEHPSFIDENTFVFLERTNDTAVAQAYRIDSGSANTLFTVPFREATVVWGDTLAGPHYVYPKPSAELEGFALAITNGQITRLPIDGFGFTMEPGPDYIIFSKRETNTYKSFTFDRATQTINPLPIVSLPEKCDYGPVMQSFICGHEFTTLDERYPDAWYKGGVTFSDMLWSIEPAILSASNLIDLEGESGRKIDVTNLTLGTNDTSAYFINHLDGTLWQYLLPQREAEITTDNQ